MEAKIAYLETIQAVINRLANNSFLLKGWAVTLVAATFALTAKNTDRIYILLAYFPAVLFWVLDAYFLGQEKLYRALYDKARLLEEKDVDFSLDTKPFRNRDTHWYKSLFSSTLLIFYGAIGLAILLVFVVL